MKKILYILILVVASLLGGCTQMELDVDGSASTGSVEVLEDGRLRVEFDMSVTGMETASVSSRAVTSANGSSWTVTESYLDDVWCLIFGEDDTNAAIAADTYSVDSPLIQCVKVTANANSRVTVTLEPYNGTAFVRFVANLTTREYNELTAVIDKTWYEIRDDKDTYIDSNRETDDDRPTDEEVSKNGIPTFGDYIYQSVGLDGIYNYTTYTTVYKTETDADGNTVYVYDYETDEDGSPVLDDDGNPVVLGYEYDYINTISPTTTSISNKFPMSSVGFVMDDISEETLAMDMPMVDMIRACSKMDVSVEDSFFTVSEIYMINCAQEARIRSTVLDVSGTTGEEVSSSFDIPKDLGGTITYNALVDTVAYNGTSSPIYFYPNSGGNYEYADGAVNKATNPQYVVIKGRSSNYDTDGYYKVALKAQYPLSADSDETNKDQDGYWSDLTYDILRNTHFNIKLISVDKPGYKTLEDAMDDDNPASNISYSIMTTSSDSRNEILVSNGTYYVELQTTRVYMSGYGTSGNSGSVKFTAYPNGADDDYQHPAIYVMSDYGVTIDSCYGNSNEVTESTITSTDVEYNAELDAYDGTTDGYNVWYKVDENTDKTEVVVNYTATSSGRIRLRIGDMLKFVPVYYDNATLFNQESTYVKIMDEQDFSYDDITYLRKFEDGDTGCEYDVEVDQTATDFDIDDYSWFGSDGSLATITEDDDDREMRAMIYPSNSNGVTKLYFCQAYRKSFDPDEKTDAGTTSLFDGNTIDLDEDYTTSQPDGSTYTGDEEEIVAQLIVDMLDEGYTSIYIDGAIGSMSIKDIMAEVVDLLGDEDYDGTFTIDISGTTGYEEDYGVEGKGGEDYFVDNPYISTIVLPSDIKKIADCAIQNCANLTTVIIGSPDDVSTTFEEIVQKAFCDNNGDNTCPNLTTIIAYTTKSVSNNYSNGTVKNSTTKTQQIVNTDGTNASGKMYLWGTAPDDFYLEGTTTIDPKYYTKGYTTE